MCPRPKFVTSGSIARAVAAEARQAHVMSAIRARAVLFILGDSRVIPPRGAGPSLLYGFIRANVAGKFSPAWRGGVIAGKSRVDMVWMCRRGLGGKEGQFSGVGKLGSMIQNGRFG